MNKKKVLFICSRERWYTRNEYIIDILNKKYKTDIISSNRKGYWSRVISVLGKFLFIKNKRKYDFIYIGFFSQILIPFIKLFYTKKIIADFFVPLYDTLCYDRKKVSPKSLLGKLIYNYEKFVLNKANFITVDTRAHKKYFAKTFKYSEAKIMIIYALANKKLFYPRNNIYKRNEKFKVFFYGTCQPLHGINIILRAAKLLENENIIFTLVGPIQKKYNDLIRNLNLFNIEFINWVNYSELPLYIAQADICLGGHFGNTKKAGRTIAGKTFQFAAMKKAIVLGDSPANREIFHNNKNCLMVKINDENDLANAILKLTNNETIREKISQNAFNTVTKIKHEI